MKTIRILFFLFILNACLQAKKSPFDISSPSGVAGFGGVQFFLEAANAPPRVTSITKVSGGSLIQFSFSKAMNPDSLTVSGSTGTFQMLNQSDNAYLAGNISTTDNINFLFRPTSSFTVNTNYSITILKTVTDSSGQNMSEDYTSSSSIVIHPYLGSFGSGGTGTGQFNKIPGVAVNSSQNIVYMTDNVNGRIQSYNQNTSSFNVLLTGFTNPFGIIVDSAGYLYFSQASGGSGIVRKINTATQADLCNTSTILNGPRGIAIDSNGIVYIAEQGASAVKKYNFPTNCSSPIIDGGLGGIAALLGTFASGQTNNVSGIAIDSSNNVYVTLESGNQVKKFDPNGNLLLSWGTTGTGNGQLSAPVGIAVDSNGYVYVAEWGNNRIQKFDSSGNPILSFTAGGAGTISHPAGVAIDSSGNVYVGDQDNNRVQKFGPP